MSSIDLVVVILGLILGYGAVSLFLRKKPRTPPASSPRTGNTDSPGAASSPPNQQPPAWHRVLELAPSASPEDIRAAYRSLMSKYHPDKVASLGSELKALAERKSKEIGAAYRDAMRSHGLDA